MLRSATSSTSTSFGDRRSSSRCTSSSSAGWEEESTSSIPACGSKSKRRAGSRGRMRRRCSPTAESGRWWIGPRRCSKAAPPHPRKAEALLSFERFVGDSQTFVHDRQALEKLLLGDAQRRIDEEVVPTDEGVEAVFPEEGIDPDRKRHLIRLRVVRAQRLPACAG